MRRSVITGSPLHATGRTRRPSSWQRLTCVPRPNRLHLMNEDTVDSLSVSISTVNYKIRERARRTCYRYSLKLNQSLRRMRPRTCNHNCRHSDLCCCSGSRVGCPAPSQSCDYSNLARSHLINATHCSHGAVSPCCPGQQRRSASTQRGGYNIYEIACKLRAKSRRTARECAM